MRNRKVQPSNPQPSPTPDSNGKNEKFSNSMVHAIPIHVTASHSPLSDNAPVQDYRGFMNLGFMMLVATNVRLILENFHKYGLRIELPGKGIPWGDWIALASGFSFLSFSIVLAYLCEARLAETAVNDKKDVTKGSAMPESPTSIPIWLKLNVCLIIVVPSIITWFEIFHPLMGATLLFQAIVIGLKIFSYHCVNKELRSEYASLEPGNEPSIAAYASCQYPQNITLRNLLYFALAPTLCYQPVYPQIPAIRPKVVLKCLNQLLTAIIMIYFILEQYTIPTVVNSMQSFEDKNLVWMAERLLKLSLSSFYIWLLMFWAIFHSYLNLMAELLRFADREFYLAWWNANTIGEYWRLWNVPVHAWLKRHVFRPMRKRGYSFFAAQVFTFVFSAIFHEYLIGIPTHVVKLWAFGAMIGQIPLITFTEWLHKCRPRSNLGNYLFWICFCVVGQPICILLYYRTWMLHVYNPDQSVPSLGQSLMSFFDTISSGF